MLSISTVIKSKWKIQGKIGQGAFGETYAAIDLHSSEDVAIKVEKLDNKKMVLKLEVIALKKLQGCPYVVRYIHSGRQDDFNFLVMERLGENLADLRKRTPRYNGSFSMSTTIRLGIQMIDALEGVHKLGYIHRDVKPSNFVMGKTKAKRGRAYLIDFGLARKYRLPSGEIRPPRKSAGFRGTARYASINSHHSKELGRRDDLWSVFYVLVEFALGSLPWRKIKDKEHIGELKERFTNAELVKDLPPEYQLFMEHLQKLGYADEPDYDYLRKILNDIYIREGYSSDEPYDWNVKEKPSLPITREVSSIIDGDVPDTRNGTTKDERGYSSAKPSSGNVSAKVNGVRNEPHGDNYFNLFNPNENKGAEKKPIPVPKGNDRYDDQEEGSEKKTGCRCCMM
jgi:tau tubulin kinase